MKKAKVFLLVTVIITGLGLFRAGMAAGAASSARPGSSNDPLITLSYLEERLAEVTGGSAAYNMVTISKGKTMTASFGTEFILYSGSATISGSKGIINLSSGQLFKNSNSITLYSLYFFQDTLTGIKASSECVVYIKGSYSIK